MYRGKKVVKHIDELGRIKLPAEIISNLNIKPGDYLEFFILEDNIAAKKYLPACAFCGKTGDVVKQKGTFTCHECIGRKNTPDQPASG